MLTVWALLLSATPDASAVVEKPEPAATTPTERRALLHIPLEGMVLEAPLSAATKYDSASSFAVDKDGTLLDRGAIDTELRIGAVFDSKMEWIPFLVRAEYEHDVITGANSGVPTLEGDGYPSSIASTDELRKLNLRVSLGWFAHLGFGFNTSHFGLGLVANDGAHGFDPTAPNFIEPRSGDRVLRGFIGSGPWTDLKLFAAVAYDKVVDDDVLLEGDEARQVAGTILIGRGLPTTAGVYFVRRNQDTPIGADIGANVIDGFGKTELSLGKDEKLSLGAEVVHVFGDTSVAATPDVLRHDIRQLGFAFRTNLDLGLYGTLLDVVYASGDSNLDDGDQNGFKADPNFQLGLLLFPTYMAAQTARAVYTASDPELLGQPHRGIERISSRGSLTNTVAFFPKAYVRPASTLVLYAGPLFAFSAVPVTDPLRTRLGGGTPRNAFDESPGSYLGTEVDIGLRYSPVIEDIATLELGGELGLLFPGDAYEGHEGSVAGGRLVARARL